MLSGRTTRPAACAKLSKMPRSSSAFSVDGLFTAITYQTLLGSPSRQNRIYERSTGIRRQPVRGNLPPQSEKPGAFDERMREQALAVLPCVHAQRAPGVFRGTNARLVCSVLRIRHAILGLLGREEGGMVQS